MTTLTRTKTDGAWSTTEDVGGGGGDLPAWWTVDSTPGSESVQFAGGVDVTKHVAVLGDDPDQTQFYVSAPADQSQPIFEVDDDGGTIFRLGPTGAVTISPSVASVVGLDIDASGLGDADGSTALRLHVKGNPDPDEWNPAIALFENGAGLDVLKVAEFGVNMRLPTYAGSGFFIQTDGVGGTVFEAKIVSGTPRLSFFDAPAVAKPTGVAVTAGGIHAALVTLGLIAA